ncbi:MAG: DUF167 domain-containing protein [Candidatus Saccharibacteria bacterium]|nr:DUF167 domain-containing protein [Candidatus Saccharibacteria bacterium]
MNIEVTVKPGAKQEKVVGSDYGLVVYLHARAHDGEANEALIKILADYYKVSKSCVEIIKGTKNRHKVVEIIK